jgi:hypothetical protein
MGERIKFVVLEKAVKVAMQYHDAFRHDIGLPYIFHPMEVCKDARDRGIVDEEFLCACVLHDTLEDTKYTEDQMLADFGPRVLSIVKEVSKIGIDDEGIEVKMDFLKHCTGKSFESLLLKLSDRYCNVMDYKNGKRIWYPSYYAIQAYPLIHHYQLNINNIISLFGNKVSVGYNDLITELWKLVYNQYKLDIMISDAKTIAKIDDILLNRRKGIYETPEDINHELEQ